MIKGATGPSPQASPDSSRPAGNLVHRFAVEEKKPVIASPPTIPLTVPMRAKLLPTVYARLVHKRPTARKHLTAGPSRHTTRGIAHNRAPQGTAHRPRFAYP